MLGARAGGGKVIDLARELRILTARIAARVVLDAELEGYCPSERRSGMVPFDELYGEDYASAPGGDPSGPLVMVRPRAPRRMETAIRIIDERIASREGRGDVLSDLVQTRFPDGGGLTRDEIRWEKSYRCSTMDITVPSSLVHFWSEIDGNDLGATLPPRPIGSVRRSPGSSDLLESMPCRVEGEHASASTRSHLSGRWTAPSSWVGSSSPAMPPCG
jgi:hypothetical protein